MRRRLTGWPAHLAPHLLFLIPELLMAAGPLVVAMSTDATGRRRFRMPDFFLISGLFLAQVIDRDWRTYLDRKVVHFVYFYLLWTAIQFAIKAPVFVHEHGPLNTIWLYIESFWEPFSTLWFIYLLPIFFVLSKATHSLRFRRWRSGWQPPRSRSLISTPARP